MARERKNSGGASLARNGLLLGAAALLLVLTFADWQAVSRESCSKHNASSDDAVVPAVIAQEYQTVAREIQMRLEHEHQLFLYQFILLGGVVGVAATRLKLGGRGSSTEQSNPENDTGGQVAALFDTRDFLLLIGVAAAALLIVDVHIRYNGLMVGELGDWVREQYERGSGGRWIGWEHHLHSEARVHCSALFPLFVSFLYLPTAVVLGVYYTLLLRSGGHGSRASWRSSRAVLVAVQICVLLFAWMNSWRLVAGAFQGDLVGVLLVLLWLSCWLAIGLVGWTGGRSWGSRGRS